MITCYDSNKILFLVPSFLPTLLPSFFLSFFSSFVYSLLPFFLIYSLPSFLLSRLPFFFPLFSSFSSSFFLSSLLAFPSSFLLFPSYFSFFLLSVSSSLRISILLSFFPFHLPFFLISSKASDDDKTWRSHDWIDEESSTPFIIIPGYLPLSSGDC